MKKIIFSIFLFFLVFAFTHVARADFASDYQNYINSTGSYQSTHNAYLTARATYLASGSLESQNKAQIATLAMLQARDNLIVSYLTAMNTKIQGTQGLIDGDKSDLANQIGSEISWYSAHNTKLTSAGSLDDLVTDSNEAKKQYSSSTLLTIYVSLINMGAANNSFIRGELNGEISTLQAKIAEIKANQDKDTSVIERSLIDIQNKIGRSEDKDNSAKTLVNSIKPTDNQGNNDFTDAQSYLSDSNAYLKEANQGLLQIITQIKSAN